jgi:hypothetical protein
MQLKTNNPVLNSAIKEKIKLRIAKTHAITYILLYAYICHLRM